MNLFLILLFMNYEYNFLYICNSYESSYDPRVTIFVPFPILLRSSSLTTLGEIISSRIKFCEIQQMKMYCDNQTTLYVASNLVFHERTKHIELDYHFIWEKMLSKEVCTEFVGSSDQLTIMLTKSLRGP